MSRSYRRKLYGSRFGNRSEKDDKRRANRRMRRVSKHRIAKSWHDDDLLMPLMDEVANLYDFASDGGKHWVGDWYRRASNPLQFFKDYLRK